MEIYSHAGCMRYREGCATEAVACFERMGPKAKSQAVSLYYKSNRKLEASATNAVGADMGISSHAGCVRYRVGATMVALL